MNAPDSILRPGLLVHATAIARIDVQLAEVFADGQGTVIAGADVEDTLRVIGQLHDERDMCLKALGVAAYGAIKNAQRNEGVVQ